MNAEYRKLPGTLRGFLNASSVWVATDHLLLVRGSRFREEYKRFYFRDVQAIAVARAPRFYFSARQVFAAALLVAVLIAVIVKGYNGPLSYAFAVFGLVALVWAGIWIYISAERSCRCRIYTAVSADELPSVYRLSTARKFLRAVEPLIAQTQGAIQGEWASAAEHRAVGPPAEATVAGATAATVAPLPRRSLASDLFLAALFADALAKIAPLPALAANWLPFIMELLSILGAVAVIVQHNRGRLRGGIHRVAVASLIAIGIIYYAQSTAVGISAGFTAGKTGKRTTAMSFPRSRLADETGAGVDAILVIVGLLVSLREDEVGRRGFLDKV